MPTEATSVVVVELTHKKRLDATVTATRSMVAVDWHPELVPGWYVVTTSTGFRAQLRACDDERCLSGELVPCTCKGARGASRRAHSRSHCHGWHDAKVVELAKQVLRSFDAPKPPDVGGVPAGRYRACDYVVCPSWPVEKTPGRGGSGVCFVDGRDRPLDYGIDVHALVDAQGEIHH